MLTCSQELLNIWEDNHYFNLEHTWNSDTAKDGVEYSWRIATTYEFEEYSARFS